MKRIIIIISLVIISLCNAGYSLAYDCDAYSVTVPEGYTVDSESISDYVSLYGDNVTVGIRTEPNLKQDDVSTYTESRIKDIIQDTLETLDTQTGNTVQDSEHSLASFSDNQYPSLYIAYQGSGGADSMLYMEEYIITTTNYIYTIVFSADKREYIDNDDIDMIKAGFTVNDDFIIHSQPADNSQVLYIFLIMCAAVLIIAIVIIYILAKKTAHTKNKRG